MSREDIKLLILESGEQVIGKITEVNGDGDVTVDKPCSILQRPDQSGRFQAYFAPYLQFSEEFKCTFPSKTIRHILSAKDALISDWDSKFGSGLVVAPANAVPKNAGSDLLLS